MPSPVPQRCYICAGQATIAVAQRDDEQHQIVDVISACPRCQGEGVIDDGFGLRELLAVADSSHYSLANDTAPCVCHYPTDGPHGRADCPSR